MRHEGQKRKAGGCIPFHQALASEYENENAVNETLERLGVDYVDACGIIGLNQESPINTGFERFGPFSLTRKAG